MIQMEPMTHRILRQRVLLVNNIEADYSELNVTEEALNDNNTYSRKNKSWVLNSIQSDAPSDGTYYARIDNKWEHIDLSRAGSLIIVNDVTDFPNTTTDEDEEITLEDYTTYLINGAINIGNRTFNLQSTDGVGKHISMLGGSSFNNKLISGTTGVLFFGDGVNLSIQQIGLSTSDSGSIFNLPELSGQLSFIHSFGLC